MDLMVLNGFPKYNDNAMKCKALNRFFGEIIMLVAGTCSHCHFLAHSTYHPTNIKMTRTILMGPPRRVPAN